METLIKENVVHRQTWCWRKSQEFYIWISRPEEMSTTLGLALSILNLRACPEWHISSNKVTLPNSATYSLWAYGSHFLSNQCSFILFFSFFFLSSFLSFSLIQGLSMYSRLYWNLLCSPGLPQTHRNPFTFASCVIVLRWALTCPVINILNGPVRPETPIFDTMEKKRIIFLENNY